MRRLVAFLAVALTLVFVANATAGVVSYPGNGWFPPHATFEWQHPDQGRDIVTDWKGVVQAPGAGCVVAIGHDHPFPGGFGPNYPWVRIDTGPFAGHVWYLGHTSALVQVGECFGFGWALARADQGRPSWIGYSEPVDGGWVELGEVTDGYPGPNNGPAGHWYDALLQQTLQVGDPLDFLSKVRFTLANGEVASEYNTVSTFEGKGCVNPVARPVCVNSRRHEALLRDRDIWVSRHRYVCTLHAHRTDCAWEELRRPNYHDDLGRRIHRLQYDLHRTRS